MTEKDIIKPWISIEDLPKDIYVEAVYDDFEGFRVLLRGTAIDAKMLRISCNDNIYYRNTDESYLLKIWGSMPKDIEPSLIYTIENSTFVEYFHEMSEGCYATWKITNYAIYSTNDCIDILSVEPLIVEWLD